MCFAEFIPQPAFPLFEPGSMALLALGIAPQRLLRRLALPARAWQLVASLAGLGGVRPENS